jgi:MoaA/NifB/PqqE/SkfB family radical SAM enzyme
VTGKYPRSKCRIERIDLTVDPYGNLVACPFLNNYVLGNIVENELTDVWNNELHWRFRAVQNDGELEMCRRRMFSAERNRRIGTSIKRIYNERILDRRYRLERSGATQST